MLHGLDIPYEKGEIDAHYYPCDAPLAVTPLDIHSRKPLLAFHGTVHLPSAIAGGSLLPQPE